MSVMIFFLTSLIYMRRLDLSIPAACEFLASCNQNGCGTVELEVDRQRSPRGIFSEVQATDVSATDS